MGQCVGLLLVKYRKKQKMGKVTPTPNWYRASPKPKMVFLAILYK